MSERQDASTDEARQETDTDDVEYRPVETDGDAVELLHARVALLTEENRRLRQEYAQEMRTKHRRVAVGMALLGIAAGVGAVLFPVAQTVLTALAGTGLFVAFLIYYLTPEQFVPASIGERFAATVATNQRAIIAELGLSDERIYAPIPGADGTVRTVRLFIPQGETSPVPNPDLLESTFVVDDKTGSRGVAFHPIGEELYEVFEQTTASNSASDPAIIADTLAEASVEVFEFATTATPQLDPDGGRCSIAITNNTLGQPDQPDYPIASLFGTGFARALFRPVWVEVDEISDGRADHVVTCRWDCQSES